MLLTLQTGILKGSMKREILLEFNSYDGPKPIVISCCFPLLLPEQNVYKCIIKTSRIGWKKLFELLSLMLASLFTCYRKYFLLPAY